MLLQIQMGEAMYQPFKQHNIFGQASESQTSLS